MGGALWNKRRPCGPFYDELEVILLLNCDLNEIILLNVALQRLSSFS